MPTATVLQRRNTASTVLVLAVAFAALAAMVVGEQRRFTARSASDPGEPATQSASRPRFDYEALRRRIIYGQASLADVRRAMTDPDPASLGNSVHALYAMRWHRGVMHLLDGMWELDEKKYPELAWGAIARVPVRIALASTINRIRIVKTGPQQEYIRSQARDPHEFNRAQVAIALGYNGDPRDLPYLREMSDGDNHYVAQSAITALALFGGTGARDILVELSDKHRGTPRGDLMRELLRKAYDWPPVKRPADNG